MSWHHDVNLVGAANTLRAAIPHLTEQKSGRIILVSSGAGRMGMPGLAHYSASKWGMFGLMKSAALEIADSRVTVNIVAPGPVETPMADNQAVYSAFVPNNNNPTREDFLDVMAQSNPIPAPWLQPEDIAEAIYFFTTDAAKQVTGTSLEISPGDIGSKELLTWQINYLRHFRNEIRKIANGKNFLTNAEIEELQYRLKIYLGNEKMARWIRESANPVAKELSKE